MMNILNLANEVLLNVQAPQLGLRAQTLDSLNTIRFEPQRLELGVGLQVLNALKALEMSVERTIQRRRFKSIMIYTELN